jgi:hypothetical protein
MNSAELKVDLIRKLDALKGNSLKEAYGLLCNYINSKDDVSAWEGLTTEQQKAIELGVKQLDNNEGRSHLEVMKELRNKFLDA